jgi:hypothetical protein
MIDADDFRDDFSDAGDNRRVCLAGVPTIPLAARLLGDDCVPYLSSEQMAKCDAAIAAGAAEIRRRHIEQLRITGHSYRRRGYIPAPADDEEDFE